MIPQKKSQAIKELAWWIVLFMIGREVFIIGGHLIALILLVIAFIYLSDSDDPDPNYD